MKTALRMNDPHFALSIYEEAGDVYFKGHRNRMASEIFYRVSRDIKLCLSQGNVIMSKQFLQYQW